jgi:hypothetical protein
MWIQNEINLHNVRKSLIVIIAYQIQHFCVEFLIVFSIKLLFLKKCSSNVYATIILVVKVHYLKEIILKGISNILA